MRDLLILPVVLGGLTAFAIPATAYSVEPLCGSGPATSSPTIDLQAIPMASTAGPKSIKGVGDDECDEARSVSRARSDGDDEEFGDNED